MEVQKNLDNLYYSEYKFLLAGNLKTKILLLGKV